MKSSAKKVELAPYDDLFSTEESRQDAKLEKVREIPLSELHSFKNHPFKVKDDEAMMETANSVRQYGVLVPAIARPDPEGGYELVGGIMSNLSGMFDSVNQQVADIATQVGQTPQGWNGSIFSMIQNLSNSIMVPIAGVILAIVMTLELILMITDRNNLHDVDTWIIFKWVFKSAAAILIVSNTWNIVMGVFDAAQSVVAQAAGIIGSDASIDISSVMTDMESRLMDMDLGPLFGLWFQSLFIGITMWALYICIFIVIYGRMIEIYLVTSVAPIPMATMMGKEWGGMGQNYLSSLIALGFQAFLIIVCVAIYAVLVQNIATESDVIMAIWSCVGYTVLPRLTLFKTGSLSKAVFNAH